MAWGSGTTPRLRWFVSAWWRWSPLPRSSAQTALSPPPPSWRAAASLTSSQPAMVDATARSGKLSPKQAKYEEQSFLSCVSVCHSLPMKTIMMENQTSLCLDHWAVREWAAERSEASRSSNCNWGPSNPETEKHGGQVSLSLILFKHGHIWTF